MKIYHQQATNLIDFDQNFDFISGENNIYYQVGNCYLQYELTIEKDLAVAANRVRLNGDVNRLVNTAFAYCFKEARLSTTGSSYIEHNKYVGQVSTIVRALTSKDGDLLSHFDKIDESGDEIGNTTSHHHLINNHDVATIKGKIK